MTASGPISGRSSLSNLIALFRPFRDPSQQDHNMTRELSYRIDLIHRIHLQAIPPDSCFFDIFELESRQQCQDNATSSRRRPTG